MRLVMVNPQSQEVSTLRKLMLLAAMLAMVLVAAAPALAQATAVQYDGGDEDNSVTTLRSAPT